MAEQTLAVAGTTTSARVRHLSAAMLPVREAAESGLVGRSHCDVLIYDEEGLDKRRALWLNRPFRRIVVGDLPLCKRCERAEKARG